jgi:ribonuclease-3
MAATSRAAKLRALARKAGARDLDRAALEAAFVHDSAVHDGAGIVSNERLEFFGDAVVGLVTAGWVFDRHPLEAEGALALRKSALVSDDALAATAERLGFSELMTFGGGTSRLPARRLRSTLAGAFEAFVGVLYREGGPDLARRFVEKQHLVLLDRVALPPADPKTQLQEYTQARFGSMPRYVQECDGPAHDVTYHARVAVDGEFIAQGDGPSKKAAQRAAAAAALFALRAVQPAPLEPAASRPAGMRKCAAAEAKARS